MKHYKEITEDDLWVPANILNGLLIKHWYGPVTVCSSYPEAEKNAIRVGSAGKNGDNFHEQVAYIPEQGYLWSYGKPARKLIKLKCTSYLMSEHIVQTLEQNNYNLRYMLLSKKASTVFLWASLLRLEAGLEPILSSLRSWKEYKPGCWERSSYESSWDSQKVSDHPTIGWSLYFDKQYIEGPEFGEEGREKLDAICLSKGIALVNGNSLIVPLPDGPVKFIPK